MDGKPFSCATTATGPSCASRPSRFFRTTIHRLASRVQPLQDAASRASEAAGSSVEQTDWHEIGEQRFARAVADALEVLARDRDVPGFVIVAPPRALADLRRALDGSVKHRIIAEIDKDLTSHPVEDIERRLTAA